MNAISLGRDAIFRVEVLVRPPLRPLLGRHEGVNLARCVLRWLVQENQEASQPTGEVGQDTFSLTLRVERANAEISLRRDGARLADEWRADDSVRVGVSVAGSRSSPADINLPLVDEIERQSRLSFWRCIPYRRSDRPVRHRRALLLCP